MKTINLSFRIPVSLADVRLLLKEKTDKRYRHNKQVLLTLTKDLIAEMKSGYWSEDVSEHFRQYFEYSHSVHSCVDDALKRLK